MAPRAAILVIIITLYLEFTRGALANGTARNERIFPTIVFGGGSEHGTVESATEPAAIVGTIPLVPTLKLAAMVVISTLLLPGLHIALTVITIVFALIGIAAFACASIPECISLSNLRNHHEDLSYHPHPFPPRPSRFPNGGFTPTTKKWDLIPSQPLPELTAILDSAYQKYRDF